MYPPLGTRVRISESQLEKYIQYTEDMLIRANSYVDSPTKYEFWSKWTLWYFDIIVYNFRFFERNRMYDTMDGYLINKELDKAYDLLGVLRGV